MSAIFYQIFIFSPNDRPLKTMNNVFLFHQKSPFRSRNIQIFVIFALLSTLSRFKGQMEVEFPDSKDKWKWNNLDIMN